jgi:hypothetical protein
MLFSFLYLVVCAKKYRYRERRSSQNLIIGTFLSITEPVMGMQGHFSGPLAKLQKATISFVTSVHLSVRTPLPLEEFS